MRYTNLQFLYLRWPHQLFDTYLSVPAFLLVSSSCTNAQRQNGIAFAKGQEDGVSSVAVAH